MAESKINNPSVAMPFNLKKWIQEHQHLLKPPVGNKNLYVHSKDYIVMIVAGPNNRTDYHYNETEELFYQIKGTIKVHIQQNGQKETIEIHEGDLFLLPAKVPHSPERAADTLGIVIERRRENQGYKDGLLWFCPKCNHKLYEVYFDLHNIEKDFLPHFEFFNSQKHLHICQKCSEEFSLDK